MQILHEDRDILVVNKEPGVASAGAEERRSVLGALTDYVRKGNPKSFERVFLIHRLERETSGVMVVARNEEARDRLLKAWPKASKVFLAWVQEVPSPAEGKITSHLAVNAAKRVYSTKQAGHGKLAETRYEVVRAGKQRALVRLEVFSDHKNQIRVHLAERGWPVVGDSKYGPKSRERVALHAQAVTFTHPHTGKQLTIEAEPPVHFQYFATPPRQAEAAPGKPPRAPKDEREAEAAAARQQKRRRRAQPWAEQPQAKPAKPAKPAKHEKPGAGGLSGLDGKAAPAAKPLRRRRPPRVG